MDLDLLLKQIDRLKPFSQIEHKVLQIVGNEDSSMKELVEVIQYDPSTTANLLRMCNSSYFALSRKITSVQQAVTYLGTDKVAWMVMTGSSSQMLGKAQAGYDLSDGELWRYSVASALIAQDIAEKCRFNNSAFVFTSALLKDLGKIILNDYVKDAAQEIMSGVRERGLTFLEAEKEVLGVDHAEIGARIGEKWGFSPLMVQVIRNHHIPKDSSSEDLSLPIVYLSDSICMMMGIGGGSDGLAYRYHQDVVDRLHFSDMDLQATIANFQEKFRSVEEWIHLS
jgi:putative nucleotidyltransferase with HDIG domain